MIIGSDSTTTDARSIPSYLRSSSCKEYPLLLHKCTKHQFIHVSIATFKDLHIENSKNKGDIARITLTVCQCAAE